MIKNIRKTVPFSIKVNADTMKKFRVAAAIEGIVSDRLFTEMLEAWEEKQAAIKAAKGGK